MTDKDREERAEAQRRSERLQNLGCLAVVAAVLSLCVCGGVLRSLNPPSPTPRPQPPITRPDPMPIIPDRPDPDFPPPRREEEEERPKVNAKDLSDEIEKFLKSKDR